MRGRVFLAGFVGLLAGSLSAEEPLRLEAGRALERELAPDQVHEHRIDLEAGRSATIVLVQRGIDVVLEASDPGGRPLWKMDAPLGAWGEERAALVARQNGEYSIRVRSLHAGLNGRYQIRVEDLRQTTARDSALEAAQAAWSEAYRLDHERTAESARLALGRYEEAASLWASAGDARQQAIALLGAARVQKFVGATDDAHATDRKVLDLARGSGDREIEARALFRLGRFLLSAGDPAEALKLFQLERSIARARANPQEESLAVDALGQAYWLLGRYQRALDSFTESLTLMRGIPDVQPQGRALTNLGLAYQELGEPEKAIPHFREALALWREARRPDEQARMLRNLSLAYSSLDLHGKALETARQALALARSIGHPAAQAAALDRVGFERLRLGESQGACADLEESLALWRGTGDVSGEAATLLNLGRGHVELGRPEQAREEWEEAIAISRRSGDRRVEALALAEISRLQLSLGDLDAAREAVGRSVELLESIRGELAEPALRRSFLSSEQGPYEIAVDVLLRLDERRPDAGFRALAFQASERGRARALAEAIAQGRLDLSGDPPARRRLEDPRDRASLEAGRPAEGGRLGEAEEWERLMGQLRRRRSAAVEYPEPISLPAARKLLAAGTALVSYAVGADLTTVFVLTEERLDGYRLPLSRVSLAERVENYVGLISRDDRDGWRAQASRLYADLVAPWRERLAPAVARLIIVPDGPLHSLPFETLVAGGPGSRRLVEGYAISYVPSATVLGELVAARGVPAAGAAASLLVLASPQVAPSISRAGGTIDDQSFDLTPVPGAAREARRVAAFGGAGSQTRIGRDAREWWVRTSPLERFGVIHFATHGLLNPRAPSQSALLLAGEGNAESGDGLLRARDIERLRLSSELVVLSACQTARGRILPGEGVEGLAQAFFHAGAKSVVASLWDVRDARTAGFMEDFYRRLSEGLSKAESLRQAKLDQLAAEPDLAPRYWAPFVLLGDGLGRIPLARQPGFPPATYLLPGAGLAGALAALAWRRRSARRLSGAA
ncbi:MAG TPA: CHAT domain-containing tetratricopeptide repeat protein [Thermoanaerobaculia bacterium]|nr:CHAT domain-containing tetratricopeptide repeat protein [Thermoanaerobaculia bacterium]